MSISDADKKELEALRASAYRFMSDPLDKAFFHLESIAEGRMELKDSVRTIAAALIELRRNIKNDS